MSLQEKMFSEVEMWLASGISKLDFIAGKEYSVAKFNYWLAKWKASQANETAGGFVILPEIWTRGLVKKESNFTKRYEKTDPSKIFA
jgi:hypothetical protein